MALATEPKLLLLDEPLAGMSQGESAAIVALLQSLRGHYPDAAGQARHGGGVFALATVSSVLVYGRIIATDTPDGVRSNPEVRAAYLEKAYERPVSRLIGCARAMAPAMCCSMLTSASVKVKLPRCSDAMAWARVPSSNVSAAGSSRPPGTIEFQQRAGCLCARTRDWQARPWAGA